MCSSIMPLRSTCSPEMRARTGVSLQQQDSIPGKPTQALPLSNFIQMCADLLATSSSTCACTYMRNLSSRVKSGQLVLPLLAAVCHTHVQHSNGFLTSAEALSDPTGSAKQTGAGSVGCRQSLVEATREFAAVNERVRAAEARLGGELARADLAAHLRQLQQAEQAKLRFTLVQQVNHTEDTHCCIGVCGVSFWLLHHVLHGGLYPDSPCKCSWLVSGLHQVAFPRLPKLCGAR